MVILIEITYISQIRTKDSFPVLSGKALVGILIIAYNLLMTHVLPW